MSTNESDKKFSPLTIVVGVLVLFFLMGGCRVLVYGDWSCALQECRRVVQVDE